MNTRQWHGVQGATGFKPGMGRFERGEAVVMIAALGIGMVVFRLLSSSAGLPVSMALALSSAIPVGVGVYLACLVVGKPCHYAADIFAWCLMRLARWLSDKGIADFEKPLIEIESDERK